MGIYIKGMEMPADDMKNIMILADGRVFQFSGYGNPKPLGTAIPVPPHGDLIDRNTLSKRIKEETINQAEFYADRRHPVVLAYGDCYSKVQNAATVIPAEESKG